MKKICIVCLSLLFVACTKENSAEQPLSTYSPVQFIYNEEKYGLFNPDTKEVVVYPRYTYIEDFQVDTDSVSWGWKAALARL